jgi:pimeloyl-ACP methyl ester carboxylesterase
MTQALKQITVRAPTANYVSLRIGYREAGTGPTILALHGVGSSSLSFAPQLEALSARFRVIAWDAPGYGGSDDFAGEPTAGIYADFASGLLDALGIATANVVGHSMGGLITTALVARHAARIQRVVLSSCASGYARMDAHEREERLANRVGLFEKEGAAGVAAARGPGNCAPMTPQPTVARVIDIMSRVRKEGYFAGAQLLDTGDVFAELGRWPTPPPPTLVMVGAHDRTTPPPGSRRIADALDGSRYQELPESAHAGYLEQPELFNTLLADHFTP